MADWNNCIVSPVFKCFRFSTALAKMMALRSVIIAHIYADLVTAQAKVFLTEHYIYKVGHFSDKYLLEFTVSDDQKIKK